MTLLSCKDLTVNLPHEGKSVCVVNNVSFELEGGGIYDLRGPSGSGKSTVLLACARMVPIASGEFFLDGKPASSFDFTQWRKRVCLVPQNAHMVEGTVRNNLLLPWRFSVRKGETPPTDAQLQQSLEAVLLDDVGLDRDASQLSGGQTARIALLRAFLAKPDVLLLDEVDAALDDDSARAVGELTVQQVREGCACLRIRHRAPDGLAATTFELKEGELSLG